MLRLFRYIALIEGWTTILLFIVAMPLKHLAGWPHLVPPVGWIHGLAFSAYVAVVLVVFPIRRLHLSAGLRCLFAAVVPFGTFANAGYVRRLVI